MDCDLCMMIHPVRVGMQTRATSAYEGSNSERYPEI